MKHWQSGKHFKELPAEEQDLIIAAWLAGFFTDRELVARKSPSYNTLTSPLFGALETAGYVEPVPGAGERWKISHDSNEIVSNEIRGHSAQYEPALREWYLWRFLSVNITAKAIVANAQRFGKMAPTPATLAELNECMAEIGVLQEKVGSDIFLHRWLQKFADRCGDALTRAAKGDVHALDAIRTDSFHTTWFEFHEFVLAMVATTRHEEQLLIRSGLENLSPESIGPEEDNRIR